MDVDFWHQKWRLNQIAFHMHQANPMLVQYFSRLNLAVGNRVFVPLCGKTLDIGWLLAQGYQVVGAELSQSAIEQLFVELDVTPTITAVGELKRYSSTNIDIFVGNIFALTTDILGRVDAVYDRAALVALPEEMRNSYVSQILEITKTAPQLLLTFEYDQSLLSGPPFSLSKNEVAQQYQASYTLSELVSFNIAGGLKGKCPALETVWLLQ